MRRLAKPLTDDIIDEALARFKQGVIARGWLDEEKAAQAVEVVREQVEATYGRDRRSQDA